VIVDWFGCLGWDICWDLKVVKGDGESLVDFLILRFISRNE
jgi:hypothetical protein